MSNHHKLPKNFCGLTDSTSQSEALWGIANAKAFAMKPENFMELFIVLL